MKVHFSFIVTSFVALLFVSGTVGCKFTGGPWYSPQSYALMTFPGSKDNSAPPYASNTPKPSLDAIPNVGTPPSGYTDGALASGNRAGSISGTPSSNPPGQWQQQPNSMAAQNSPGPYDSYTNAAPSQYSPYTDPYAGQGVSTSYQYQAGANPQYQNMMLHENSQQGYSSQMINTSAYSPQTNPGMVDNGTNYNNAYNHNPYAGTTQPGGYEPYVIQQQPATAPSTGGYYDQAAPSPHQGYPSDGISVAQPQSYQAPPAGTGYNNYSF